MKKTKEFDNVLDECLERLLVKGETIEQCLASYPEQATELEPLLQTALATRKASAIQPRPEFRAAARYQFRSALRQRERKRRFSFLSWQPRWVAIVAVVLVLLLAGSSTVATAGNSMPDEPLYRVKLATEQARLTLTPSALAKAELYTKLADRRVAEIIYMVNKGKPEQVERTTQRLNNYLAMVAVLARSQRGEGEALMVPALLPAPEKGVGEDEGTRIQVDSRARLRIILARYAVNHPTALRAVLKTAPESAKPALRRAIAISVVGYETALKAAGE